MKYKFFFLLIFLFINITIFAQVMGKASKRGNKVGKKFFNDLIFAVDPSIAKMNKNNTFIIDGYISWLFNNKFYAGIYYEKKVGNTVNTSTRKDTLFIGNLNYKSIGVNIGGYYPLKIGKTRSSKSNNRLNFTLKTGLATLSLNDSVTNKPFIQSDYGISIIPSLGYEKTVNKVMSIGFGFNYHYILRANLYYEKSKDISGPGAYVTLRFSFLDNNWAKHSSPRF